MTGRRPGTDHFFIPSRAQEGKNLATKPPVCASSVSLKLVTNNCKNIDTAKCAMKSLTELAEIMYEPQHDISNNAA